MEAASRDSSFRGAKSFAKRVVGIATRCSDFFRESPSFVRQVVGTALPTHITELFAALCGNATQAPRAIHRAKGAMPPSIGSMNPYGGEGPGLFGKKTRRANRAKPIVNTNMQGMFLMIEQLMACFAQMMGQNEFNKFVAPHTGGALQTRTQRRKEKRAKEQTGGGQTAGAATAAQGGG